MLFRSATNVNGVNTGATDFRFTGMQVEPGSVSTEFEIDPIEAEISSCQRYYWKSFPFATGPAQNAGTTGALLYRPAIAGFANHSRQVHFPVLMRIPPTIITYNPSAANANWRNINAAADSGVPSLTGGTDAQFEITNPQVAGDVVGVLIAIHATADAEL